MLSACVMLRLAETLPRTIAETHHCSKPLVFCVGHVIHLLHEVLQRHTKQAQIVFLSEVLNASFVRVRDHHCLANVLGANKQKHLKENV